MYIHIFRMIDGDYSRAKRQRRSNNDLPWSGARACIHRTVLHTDFLHYAITVESGLTTRYRTTTWSRVIHEKVGVQGRRWRNVSRIARRKCARERPVRIVFEQDHTYKGVYTHDRDRERNVFLAGWTGTITTLGSATETAVAAVVAAAEVAVAAVVVMWEILDPRRTPPRRPTARYTILPACWWMARY